MLSLSGNVLLFVQTNVYYYVVAAIAVASIAVVAIAAIGYFEFLIVHLNSNKDLHLLLNQQVLSIYFFAINMNVNHLDPEESQLVCYTSGNARSFNCN